MRPVGLLLIHSDPLLSLHRQGQDSNEDVAPLEQLNATTLFLGQAEAGERKRASGGGQLQSETER